MSTATPRIRVREATPADARQMADVQFEAFGPDVFNRLMYPAGDTEDSRQRFAAGLFQPETPEAPKKEESVLTVAELLPEEFGQAEIVAFARWIVRRESRPEEEWNVPEPPRTAEQLGKDCNIEVFTYFIGALHDKRREHTRGNPAVVLGVLASKRPRVGAGSALLEYGVKLADGLGLPTFLEASPKGYPLYCKFGYEDIDFVDFHIAEKYGAVQLEGENWGTNTGLTITEPAAKGVVRSVIMKRPAKVSAA
ncbi:hypothetical protein B0T26DRAFT_670977 [Lasiosphaeria miniovina]|uniref:N-acetyltransferase domain-containing protein n=1 Tax=Lasiosphaeria miniovina TaxID=1954250 RepID=A0AA40BIJ1_9PEZI|nr:uncharacterized protein B0T26DRAFT_670977 [Lasiosphaeria miniovina]KAK0734723.1 hypothetical protein B0T26DRAFT_670977 [Lasiosphaeria miniovina]